MLTAITDKSDKSRSKWKNTKNFSLSCSPDISSNLPCPRSVAQLWPYPRLRRGSKLLWAKLVAMAARRILAIPPALISVMVWWHGFWLVSWGCGIRWFWVWIMICISRFGKGRRGRWRDRRQSRHYTCRLDLCRGVNMRCYSIAWCELHELMVWFSFNIVFLFLRYRPSPPED